MRTEYEINNSVKGNHGHGMSFAVAKNGIIKDVYHNMYCGFCGFGSDEAEKTYQHLLGQKAEDLLAEEIIFRCQ